MVAIQIQGVSKANSVKCWWFRRITFPIQLQHYHPISLVLCVTCSDSLQTGVFQAWREAPLTGSSDLKCISLEGGLLMRTRGDRTCSRSFSRMVLKAEVSEMCVISLVILSLLEARMQARSSRYWFLVISLLSEKSWLVVIFSRMWQKLEGDTRLVLGGSTGLTILTAPTMPHASFCHQPLKNPAD